MLDLNSLPTLPATANQICPVYSVTLLTYCSFSWIASKMSDYSGYSSASRMEIARVRKEKKAELAKVENEKKEMAIKMAAQETQMAAQAAALANMQALLVASGIMPTSTAEKVPCLPSSSGVKTKTQTQPHAQAHTPSRKRRSSQPLGDTSKDSKFLHNRFEALMDTTSASDMYADLDDEFDQDFPDLNAAQSNSLNNHAQARSHAVPRPQSNPTQKLPTSFSEALARGTSPETGIEPIFKIENVNHMRQEIVVMFEKLNGEIFRGSITPQEAKHEIYKKCLGFVDFSNFDGVRSGYRNGPVAVFKLKTAINVDELLPVQYFDFKRSSSRQGQTITDTISCKIMGLRHPNQGASGQVPTGNPQMDPLAVDDGTRLVTIEGCEYRIPSETLIGVLSAYGELKSKITEVLFNDGSDPSNEEDGTNRTGNYSVRIKLSKPIPQLIPILDKRIKIHYPGVQKQCTNCFRNHPKKVCKSAKIYWIDYVKSFANSNPEIPIKLISKHYESWAPKDVYGPTMTVTEPSENEVQVETVLPNSTTNGAKSAKIPPKKSVELSNQESSSQISAPSALIKNGPTPEEFLIPKDNNEHQLMVARLVSGGLLRKEAEMSIAARKTAFNKATKEFLKKGNKQTKKAGRPSKHFNVNNSQYDN